MQVKRLGKRMIFILLFLSFLGKAIAQHSTPDTIKVITVDKINFDGKLLDPVWLTAPFINNFTQRELDFGKPSTEQTKVAVVMVLQI